MIASNDAAYAPVPRVDVRRHPAEPDSLEPRYSRRTRMVALITTSLLLWLLLLGGAYFALA